MDELKQCPICDNEEWEYLNELRNNKYWYDRNYLKEGEETNFKICKHCGFLTYDYIEMTDLKESYDNQRKMMQAKNVVTCNRKNLYHSKFIPKLTVQGRCLDVGCAQGAFLDLLHKEYDIAKDDLYGTEWAQAFRAWGKYEYGLDNITKDIDESIKYDFISYYHVLEHIQNPDKELMKCRELLTNGGFLYISVPIWGDKLDEHSGGLTADWENYYHLNHVDCFTETSFRNLLNKTGWRIYKEDLTIYGMTVLCEKVDIPKDQIIECEDYNEIIKKLKSEKKAIELLNTKKWEEALDIIPTFPDCYVYYSLNKENMKELDKQLEVLNRGLKVLPGNVKLLNQMGKAYFQWDENTPDNHGFYSNNIRKAEDIFLDLLERKPAEDVFYFLSIINARYKKDFDMAAYWLKRVLEINPSQHDEMMNFLAKYYKEKGVIEDV